MDKRLIVAITGQSGCGKSTVLNILANLDTKSGGNIEFKEDIKIGLTTDRDTSFPQTRRIFIGDDYAYLELYIKGKNFQTEVLDKIATLESQNSALSSSLSSAQSALTAAQSNIATLQSDLAAALQRIAALEGNNV